MRILRKVSVSAGGGVIGGSNLITPGAVPYVSAPGTLNEDQTAGGQLFWDATNHRLGIGNNAPVTELEVSSSRTATPRGITSAQFNTGTNGAHINLRKGRGTELVPLVIVTGDNLGLISATGYDGANFLEMGAIIFGAEGTIAATRVPTNIRFSTGTDATPSVLTERLRIDSAGLSSFTGTVKISSLTSGRIPFAGTGGLLGDSANLTFASATLTLATSGVLAFSTDSAFSRISAGLIGVGTGAQGSVAGRLQLTSITGAAGTTLGLNGAGATDTITLTAQDVITKLAANRFFIVGDSTNTTSYMDALGNSLRVSNSFLGWTSSPTNAFASTDLTVSRNAAGIVQIGTTVANALGSLLLTNLTASGDVTFSTAAKGPIFKQGANGRVGTFVANGVTPVTVNNTSVAITDAIIISLNTPGGTVSVAPPSVQTITGASGFTIVAAALDTSTYNYAIIKNAA